jgi:hypothetical protein
MMVQWNMSDLMRNRFSLVLLVVLFPNPVALAQQATDWVKVAPAGAGFSVMMPGNPQEEIKPGDDFTSHLFTVRTDKAIYLVGYGDYAPAIRLNVKAELIANRDNFLKDLGARLIDSKEIKMGDREGLEFTGESDQATFRSRVYLFGNRVHQIGVAVLKGQDDAENANKFLASFAFAKP